MQVRKCSVLCLSLYVGDNDALRWTLFRDRALTFIVAIGAVLLYENSCRVFERVEFATMMLIGSITWYIIDRQYYRDHIKTVVLVLVRGTVYIIFRPEGSRVVNLR